MLDKLGNLRCSESEQVVYLGSLELDGGVERHRGEVEGRLLLGRWSKEKMGSGGQWLEQWSDERRRG
jgi:hypothetical protein